MKERESKREEKKIGRERGERKRREKERRYIYIYYIILYFFYITHGLTLNKSQQRGHSMRTEPIVLIKSYT